MQSLQATLSRLAEEPFSIIEVLGNDLPKFASFYVSFILLKALADLPRVLLQVGGLVQFAARFGQGPNPKAMYRAMRGKGGGAATPVADGECNCNCHPCTFLDLFCVRS